MNYYTQRRPHFETVCPHFAPYWGGPGPPWPLSSLCLWGRGALAPPKIFTKLKLERSKLILGSVDKGISSTKISLIVLMRIVNREQKNLGEFSVLARIFQNEKLQKMSFRIISFKSIYSNQGLVKGAELCLHPYFFGWLEK